MEDSTSGAGIGWGHQGLTKDPGEHSPQTGASRLGQTFTTRIPRLPCQHLPWDRPPHRRASPRAAWQ